MKQLFDDITNEKDLTARYLLELAAIGDCGPGARGEMKHTSLEEKVNRQYAEATRRLASKHSPGACRATRRRPQKEGTRRWK
jgi:hypothetical protein